MKVAEKATAVEKLAERLGESGSFYITDFTGLNVKAMTALRAKLREAGLQYLVVKNSLAGRAMEQLELSAITELFVGPTGLVIGGADPVAPAKVLSEFAKDHDDRPLVRGGVVDKRAVTIGEIDRLSKLPPREILLAQAVGALEAPMAQFAYALEAKLNEFAGLIEALQAERSA
jgi:large subunit ribosomal protein L10